MNSYNKRQALTSSPKEQGFIHDNLERWCDWWRDTQLFPWQSFCCLNLLLLKVLCNNLTVFQLPRLSGRYRPWLYVGLQPRNPYLHSPRVNSEIHRCRSDGYRLRTAPDTAYAWYWVFHYTNAAGNNDGIKIENQLFRPFAILPAIELNVSIRFWAMWRYVLFQSNCSQDKRLDR